MSMVISRAKTALLLLLSMTLITGLIYPAVVTFIAQTFFKAQANGSLVMREGKVVGSQLLGQTFTSARYFSARPSATTPYPYNAASSSGRNAGPTNKDFLTLMQARVSDLKKANPDAQSAIPVDLVTASASGLDPDISVRAALYQIPRVAKARGVTQAVIEMQVNYLTQGRTFNVLGESRVNVLALNLALDAMSHQGRP